MDLGVIHTIKSHYRQRLVRRLLALFEGNNQFNEKDIDLYEALVMLSNTWNELNPTVIQNCFIKSGVKLIQDIIPEETEVQTAPEEDSQCQSEWSELTHILDMNELDFNDYVVFDDNIISEGLIEDTNEEIETSLNQTSDAVE